MFRLFSPVALAIIFLLTCADLSAQSRRLYYNRFWELTTPANAQYYRDCEIDTVRRVFNGAFTDYHVDGVKLMAGKYLDGQRTGLFSTWFRNGQLESEGKFENKIQSGIWKYYYDDGRDRQEVDFNDHRFRVVSFYDSTGKQQVVNGSGQWYEFYEDYGLNGVISNEGEFVDGKKNGTWTTSFNGVPIIIEKFNNGEFKRGNEVLNGKAGQKYPSEILNKLKPHYKFEITEKWTIEKGSTPSDTYPFLFRPVIADNDDRVFLVVEQPATFDGGMGAMYRFIGSNLTYPQEARRKGIEGSVFVVFIVNIDGSISDAEIVKGIGPSCDNEALRLVRSFPNWIPGKQNGKIVKTKFVLPISFRLGATMKR